MGCSHNAWHGTYGTFMQWRRKLAGVAGLPPLDLMAGFYSRHGESLGPNTFYYGPETGKPAYYGPDSAPYFASIEETLPIRWECLKPSPLHELLRHSDCEGEIPSENCAVIADALEALIPLLPDEQAGGHIGAWQEKTQQFVDGLRAAAAAGEPLDFH